ncbi:MAG: hypothetical protein ABFD64_02900 [Armatimonadota bacterium]
MATTVAAAIQGAFDRIAKLRQDAGAIAATGTRLWKRVDDTDDETFENRMDGDNLTAADAALVAMSFWANAKLKTTFEDLTKYFRIDLALASPYWEKYLATIGWRVPYGAAEALFEAMGANYRLSSQYVFPRGTLVADAADPTSAGLHKFGRITGTTGASTYASVDGALPATVKGAPILAINDEATPGLTNLIVTATNQAGATKDLTVTTGNTQYTQEVLGQQLIAAAGAAAGQKVVPVPATAAFAVGEYILIVKSDFSIVEVALIASIQANASLTVTTNLINTFAQNDLVWPMFTNLTIKSGTAGNGKHISFYARPDRIIAL